MRDESQRTEEPGRVISYDFPGSPLPYLILHADSDGISLGLGGFRCVGHFSARKQLFDLIRAILDSERQNTSTASSSAPSTT